MSVALVDLLQGSAVIVAVGGLIKQIWSLQRLIKARARARDLLAQDDVLRLHLQQALRAARSPDELHEAIEAFQRKLRTVDPRDAKVIERSIGAQSDHAKAKFVEQLVA